MDGEDPLGQMDGERLTLCAHVEDEHSTELCSRSFGIRILYHILHLILLSFTT